MNEQEIKEHRDSYVNEGNLIISDSHVINMIYNDLDNNHAIHNYLISTTKHVILKHRNEVKHNNAARNSISIIF